MSCPKCGSDDVDFQTKMASESCRKEYITCNTCGYNDVDYHTFDRKETGWDNGTCPKCGSDNIDCFTKDASEDCVKEYWDCYDCGNSEVNYIS